MITSIPLQLTLGNLLECVGLVKPQNDTIHHPLSLDNVNRYFSARASASAQWAGKSNALQDIYFLKSGWTYLPSLCGQPSQSFKFSVVLRLRFAKYIRLSVKPLYVMA